MRYFYLSLFHFIIPGRVKYKEANGPIYIVNTDGETSVNTRYTNKILPESVSNLHQNTDTLIKQILATVWIIDLYARQSNPQYSVILELDFNFIQKPSAGAPFGWFSTELAQTLGVSKKSAPCPGGVGACFKIWQQFCLPGAGRGSWNQNLEPRRGCFT